MAINKTKLLSIVMGVSFVGILLNITNYKLDEIRKCENPKKFENHSKDFRERGWIPFYTTIKDKLLDSYSVKSGWI